MKKEKKEKRFVTNDEPRISDHDLIALLQLDSRESLSVGRSILKGQIKRWDLRWRDRNCCRINNVAGREIGWHLKARSNSERCELVVYTDNFRTVQKFAQLLSEESNRVRKKILRNYDPSDSISARLDKSRS